MSIWQKNTYKIIPGTSIRRIVYFLSPLIIFVFYFNLFQLNAPHIFIGFDGNYILGLALRQLNSVSDILALNGDFVSALGHIYYPVNFKLIPSFWFLYWIQDIKLAKAALLSCVLLEVFFLTVLFARAAGLNRLLAVIASAVVCASIFPFYQVGYVFSVVPITPGMGTSIAVTQLIAVCFMRYGSETAYRHWPWATAFIALIAWCCFASITWLVISAAFIVLSTLGVCLFAENKQERMRKAMLLGIAAILFCTFGPLELLAGFTLNSVPALFPGQLQDNVSNLESVSIFFNQASYGLTGPVLVMLAVFGALWSIKEADRTERIFAGITLVFLLGLAIASISMLVSKTWRGPAPIYLEHYFIPLYAIFAVRLVSRSLNICVYRFLPLITKIVVPIPDILVACLAMACSVCVVRGQAANDYGFNYPPRASSITDILVREIGLVEGGEFRGRVVTLTGRTISQSVTWIDLHSGDASRERAIGNEHRLTGLSYFHIPNLFPYGPTLSPAYFIASRKLLSEPNDIPMRNVTVLRKIAPSVLGMIGARFFITDLETDQSAKLRTKIPSDKSESLFLYEIENTNTGQFSPTKVILEESIDGALNRISSSDFDPQAEIVVLDRLIGKELSSTALSKARHVKLKLDGAALHFRASSDGQSVVLLPFDFSHCTEVINLGESALRVFRANVFLMGVQFVRQADIQFITRTGPLSNPGCQLADRDELISLQAGKVAF